MYIKRIRRKCGVRGCRSLDTYNIALTPDGGQTVIMCRSCIDAAVKAVSECTQPPVKFSAGNNSSPPPLFGNVIEPTTIEPETADGAKAVVEDIAKRSAEAITVKKPSTKRKAQTKKVAE